MNVRREAPTLRPGAARGAVMTAGDEREHRLEVALAAGRLGAWHADIGSDVIEMDAACKANFGLAPDAPFDTTILFDVVDPVDRGRVRRAIDLAVAGHEDYDLEYRVRWPDGSLHWLIGRGRALYDAEGKPWRIVGVTIDVTARKHAEEQVAAAAADRDAAMKEVTHRVKNSFQLIASLLTLQASRADDPKMRQAFDEARARVYTVARVHERLYSGGDVDNVEMADYLRHLCTDLSQTYGEGRDHRLVCDVRPAWIPTDKVIPLGLIVAEAVGNALKYAFPDHKGGRITVSLMKGEDNWRLAVADNGVGLPDPGAPPKGVGMAMISALAGQIGAKAEFSDENPGLRLTVSFSL